MCYTKLVLKDKRELFETSFKYFLTIKKYIEEANTKSVLSEI